MLNNQMLLDAAYAAGHAMFVFALGMVALVVVVVAVRRAVL